MKRIKRWTALVLAVALAACLACPTALAEPAEPLPEGELTRVTDLRTQTRCLPAMCSRHFTATQARCRWPTGARRP